MKGRKKVAKRKYVRKAQVAAPQVEPSAQPEPAAEARHKYIIPEGYSALAAVMIAAMDQAAKGKGKERHAQGLDFKEQPMQTISALLNTDRGMLYQAINKIQESTRLGHYDAVQELLGAINYIAGAVLYINKGREAPTSSQQS